MIIHADMDAFYASVEIRDAPHLADKPVVVAGSAESRGVVSAANYVARRYNVRSAMPTKTALKLCPQLIILPGRISKYVEVSRQIHDIFARYTPVIEPLSLDEAFLDVTDSERLFGSALNIATAIKQNVREELKLVVSVGVASNKFIAKIASDIKKPDGLVVVAPGQEQAFLDPLPVSRIWGIGKQTNAALAKYGIETIAQLRSYPLSFLAQQFGKQGGHIWDLAHGRDPRRVTPDREAKSISHERTFAEDIQSREILLQQLSDLCEQVAWRLRHENLRARGVQLKIRFADFSLITRARRLGQASNSTDLLWHCAKQLFVKEEKNWRQAIRLIGIGATELIEQQQADALQSDLFDSNVSKQAIDKVSDEIREKLGAGSIKRASSIQRHPKDQKGSA